MIVFFCIAVMQARTPSVIRDVVQVYHAHTHRDIDIDIRIERDRVGLDILCGGWLFAVIATAQAQNCMLGDSCMRIVCLCLDSCASLSSSSYRIGHGQPPAPSL